MVKEIAVYGSFRTKAPVRQRYRKRRIDGFFQRYWKKTSRTKTVERSGRYEFTGVGKDLYKAVARALRVVPRGFVTVNAEKFVDRPEKYGTEGEWIEKQVVS